MGRTIVLKPVVGGCSITHVAAAGGKGRGKGHGSIAFIRKQHFSPQSSVEQNVEMCGNWLAFSMNQTESEVEMKA